MAGLAYGSGTQRDDGRGTGRAGGPRAQLRGHDVRRRAQPLQYGADRVGVYGVCFLQTGVYVLDDFLSELRAAFVAEEYGSVVESTQILLDKPISC
ncbi:hypothetical protein P3L51_18855 [Streptomyces sp. PSRA5]